MQEAGRPSLESEEKTGKSGGQGGRDQSKVGAAQGQAAAVGDDQDASGP